MNLKKFFDDINFSSIVVYEKYKNFFIQRLSLIIAFMIAIILYHFCIDKSFPILKTFGYISVFTFFIIIFYEFILFPLFLKHIVGYGLNGIWEGKITINNQTDTETRNINMKFEIKDFGTKCLIRVITDRFVSNSVVVYITAINNNEVVVIRFIYYVKYPGADHQNHYGLTEMYFYRDGEQNPCGRYIANDNNEIKWGLINLNKKLQKKEINGNN